MKQYELLPLDFSILGMRVYVEVDKSRGRIIKGHKLEMANLVLQNLLEESTSYYDIRRDTL